MKYPGGYQIIDLGGIIIEDYNKPVAITDPAILKRFNDIYDAGFLSKPLYITGVSIVVLGLNKIAYLSLEDQITSADSLCHYFLTEGGVQSKLNIDLGTLPSELSIMVRLIQ